MRYHPIPDPSQKVIRTQGLGLNQIPVFHRILPGTHVIEEIIRHTKRDHHRIRLIPIPPALQKGQSIVGSPTNDPRIDYLELGSAVIRIAVQGLLRKRRKGMVRIHTVGAPNK